MSRPANDAEIADLVAHAEEVGLNADALRTALMAHEPEIRLLPNGEHRYECVFEGNLLEPLSELVQRHLFHGTGLDRVRRLETGVEILGRLEFGSRLRVAVSSDERSTRLSVHHAPDGSAGLWATLLVGVLVGGAVVVFSPLLGIILGGVGVGLGWWEDRRQFRRRVKALLLDVHVGLYERRFVQAS